MRAYDGLALAKVLNGFPAGQFFRPPPSHWLTHMPVYYCLSICGGIFLLLLSDRFLYLFCIFLHRINKVPSTATVCINSNTSALHADQRLSASFLGQIIFSDSLYLCGILSTYVTTPAKSYLPGLPCDEIILFLVNSVNLILFSLLQPGLYCAGASKYLSAIVDTKSYAICFCFSE